MSINELFNNYFQELFENDEIDLDKSVNIGNHLDEVKESLDGITNKMLSVINISEKILDNDKCNQAYIYKMGNNIENLHSINLEKRLIEEENKKIINCIISIIDAFEPLIENNESDVIRKIIDRELKDIKIFSLCEIGDLYNENYHKCVGYIENNNKIKGEILEVLKKGYIYNNQVIRIAEVIVSK